VTCTNLGKEIGIKFQHKLFEPVNWKRGDAVANDRAELSQTL
jgi:hypothetical protein